MNPVDLNVAVVDSIPQLKQTDLAADYSEFQNHTPLQN